MNLDPFQEFTDAHIWDVLGKVELRTYVAAQREGLNMAVLEGGSNLSAGQRQLLCLARALMRDNSVLVIDEATANVDQVRVLIDGSKSVAREGRAYQVRVLARYVVSIIST